MRGIRKLMVALAALGLLAALLVGMAAFIPQRMSANVICHDILYWRLSATEVQLDNILLEPMTGKPRLTIYYKVGEKTYNGVKPGESVKATLPKQAEPVDITATVVTNDGRSGTCVGRSAAP